MSAEGYTPGQAGDFSAPQDAAPSGGFAQGQAGDFSDLGGSSAPDGSIGAGAGTGSGGWGMLNNVWKATTQLARDVGAGALLDDVKMGMNKVKANQLGDALVLVEELPEVEKALAYGRETKLKYEQLFRSMMDGANDAARTATPLRRAGAAFIRCAGISDKVAREMATSGREGFYKETPTYQQDLNEALLVTSGAMLYHADRQQAFFTTDTTIEASKANFEQGTYSTKYYVKREAFGPGPMAAACKVVQQLLLGEVLASERARRKYKDLRLDLSIRKREREIAAAKGQPAEEGFEAALAADMDTLAAHREDVLSAHRVLAAAKDAVAAQVRELLAAEREVHAQAVKSLTATLAALPNAPVSLPKSA